MPACLRVQFSTRDSDRLASWQLVLEQRRPADRIPGHSATSLEREVPYAEGPEQAREIINAQIALGDPLVSAVPSGTALRAVYLTARGDAYVDLSREAVTAHPGGTLNELLTVYTIVNALTVNLPAVHSVQILIDGKEVETLAGHVDLRQPLAKNLGLVQ